MAPGSPRSGRVLVLGGTGMLGHKLWQRAAARGEAWGTVRAAEVPAPLLETLGVDHAVAGVSVDDLASVRRALASTRPAVVVNCMGIVKQSVESLDPVASISVNSLFPHQLAAMCREQGARLVHVSTDCVFSGRSGGYTEDDVCDPVDLYGRSKLLGEVTGPGCLTLRTSFVGRELDRARGLLEWLCAQTGRRVPGFARAVFSGLTTPAVGDAILDLATAATPVEGTFHLAAAPITKLDLLVRLRDAFALDVDIVPDDSVVVDRSLCASALIERTGWSPPTWDAMVAELASDPTPYDDLRAAGARR